MMMRTVQSEYREEEQTRKSAGRVALFMLVFLMMPGIASRAFAATLSVSKIVVSQGTQRSANSVPLVTSRSTVVRATIGISGAFANIPSVTAKLYVYVNDVLKTPNGIPAINQPFTAKVFPSDSKENDTLNFELLAPTVMVPPSPLSNSVKVRFRIDLFHRSHTTTDYVSGDFNFQRRATPRIYYTRINYTPAGQGLPLVSMVQAGRGDQMVKGMYPINDGSSLLYQPALAPTMSYSNDPNNDNIMQQSEGWDLLDDLEAARQLIVDNGNGADDRTFLYGWIKGNPTDHNGQAVINGRVGYGNTEASRFQRTFAHELGHMFGFHHPNADAPKNLDQLGWDVDARLPYNPASNNVIGRLKPLSLWDIMVGGKLTKDAWIRSDRYTTLFNHDTLKPASLLPIVTNAVAVNFFVHPGDPVQIEWRSVFRYPWLSGPSKRFQEDARFILRSRFADGSVHDDPFDVQAGDGPAEREGGIFGPVSLILPYSEQLTALEVIDGTSGQRLSRINRSLLLPAVNVISPQPGAVLGNSTVVEFEVTDGDTDLGDLRFHVAYSWDNGNSFVPVAVNLQVPRAGGPIRFRWDSAAVPPSNGQGMLLFLGSDGGNMMKKSVPDLYTPSWVTSKVTLQECLFPTDQPVTVRIHYHDNDNNPANDFAQQVVTLAEDGTYTLTGVRPVDCSIQVKADKWLAKSVSAHFNGSGQVFADNVTLLAGDANNDNSADVLDLDLVLQAFDSTDGEPNFISEADFNCDNWVDVLDLALLLTNFDQVGDPLP